ncbi:conserved hypothetical protein [Klebsiella pneumoniae]|nr:conserved hypothetical protein [Klebsiella pneumoniae]
MSLPALRLAGLPSRAISGQIALPICLLRYVTYGAWSAQGAASRRRPLYPRAPASNIAAARCLRLIPAAPAVSAAPAPAVIWGCRPGKAQPPPGIKAAPCLMPSPGGAVACRAYRQSEPDE